MRFFYTFLGVLTLLMAFVPHVRATSAAIDALGQPLLVLEEEATVSSIFNQGNPAGLVFVPNQTRLDLNISTDYTVGRYKYNTYPRMITADGSVIPHIDPNGNTIIADAWFAQNSYSFSSTLNDESYYQWSGLIFRPIDSLSMQIIPTGNLSRNANDEDMTPSRVFATGLEARSAYKITDQLALGIGIGYSAGKEDGWKTGMFEKLFTGTLINQALFSEQLNAEFGTNWRSEGVFDNNDILDIGFLIKADQTKTYGDLYFDSRLITGLDDDPTANTNNVTLPWSVGLTSSYNYKSVMNIAFQFGYEEAKDYFNWSSDYFNSIDPFVYSTLDNYYFDLSLRVRLPMVREDDLRFGVAFTNKGVGNMYPTGQIKMDLPGQASAIADINTSSSSIAIETGVVPYDGSLISLKYHLGSSKSIQSDVSIEDYGYTDFSFGLKFKLLDWLTLNSSYSNLRQATEGTDFVFEEIKTIESSGNTTYSYSTAANPIIKAQETNTLRFGIGVKTKTWDLDWTTAAYRVAYSPTGWPYRPTNTEIDEEFNYGYYSMLSFIYRY